MGNELVVGAVVEGAETGAGFGENGLGSGNFFGGTNAAVGEDPGFQFFFGFFGKVGAHDKWVIGNEWALPDDFDLFGGTGVGCLQATHAFGVIGGNVSFFVGNGKGVGFVAGIGNRLEETIWVQVATGPDVERGDQKAGGGVGVTVGEIEFIGVIDDIVDGLIRAVLVDDDQGPVTWVTFDVGGLGENFATGTVNGFECGGVTKPSEFDFIGAHCFDNAGVVRSKEGFNL